MSSKGLVAPRVAYKTLKEALIGSPHVLAVIVEGRVELLPASHEGWFDPYEEHDVFVIIVDELTEELFDAIPNSWHSIPVEVLLNGTRKRLM